MFGRATIRLAIGPHSSFLYFNLYNDMNIIHYNINTYRVVSPAGILSPCHIAYTIRTVSYRDLFILIIV